MILVKCSTLWGFCRSCRKSTINRFVLFLKWKRVNYAFVRCARLSAWGAVLLLKMVMKDGSSLPTVPAESLGGPSWATGCKD